MTTIDIRNAAFEDIFAQINHIRFAVWSALKAHGPGTTREIARASGIDLLTLRPRVTELCALGFAYLAGKAGKEGVYAARDYAEARAYHDSLRGADTQLHML